MTGLGRKAASGVFWTYLTFLATKGINLVSMVVLARMLGPDTFGEMAICIAVIGYFEIVAKFGLGAALITEQAEQAQMETAVAVMSVISSSLMVCLAWLSAPLVAGAFDEPGLVWALRIIALAMFIDAIAVVPNTLLAKQLKFRRKAVPDIARSVIKAASSITLVWFGFGIFGLVAGHVIGTTAGAAAAFVAAPWKPSVWPRREVLWNAFRFGQHLLLAEVINSAQRNLDALLVGKLLGTTALGIYSLAFRFPDLLIRSFNQVAGTVLHPVISSGGGGKESLAQLYLSSLRHIALVTFPAAAALALSADPIVDLLYTPEWYAMKVPMAFLSVSLGLLTIDFVPGIIYKAMGRTDYLFWTSLMKLPLFVVVLLLVAPFGLNMIALAQIGLSLCYFVPNWLILRRNIGVTLPETMRALVPACLLSLATAVAGFGVSLVGIETAVIELAVLGLSCAAVFVVGMVFAVPELRTRFRRAG